MLVTDAAKDVGDKLDHILWLQDFINVEDFMTKKISLHHNDQFDVAYRRFYYEIIRKLLPTSIQYYYGASIL